MTYDIAKSHMTPLRPLDEKEEFYKHVGERFLICQEDFKRKNRGYGFYCCNQIESSKYLPEIMSKQRLPYFFDKSYRIYEKRGEEIGNKAHDFIAINPIRSRKIFYNKNIKIYDYTEIHTKDTIYACLYDVSDYKEYSPNNFFDTPYGTIAVTRCLKLTTCTGRYEPPAEDLSTVILDRMRVKLDGNRASIEDFEIICRQPNRRFLLCCIAYSILAFNDERFGKLRDDISVPFLLVAECSSVSDNKPISANNDMLAYVKRVYSACCMPNGIYSEGFPLKTTKEYETHINKQQNAGKITLIVHNEKTKSTATDKPSEVSSIREGFPEFYRIIDASDSVKQFYPYNSLPFIVTTNKADFPEKYFLKFDAKEIGESDKTNEVEIMRTLTRIVQTACISLNQKNITPDLLKLCLNDVLIRQGFNRLLSSFDSTDKRDADLIYLIKILLVTVNVVFWKSETIKTQEDGEKVIRLYSNVVDSIQNIHHLSPSSLEPSVLKEYSEKSPVDHLLTCIAKDLKIGGIFTEDSPQAQEDYVKVKFAFIYCNSEKEKTLLCFRRPNQSSKENTFETYIQDRLAPNNELTVDEIWKQLCNTFEYRDLTFHTKGNNYYKYPALGVQVYAFDIDAVKVFLDKQKKP